MEEKQSSRSEGEAECPILKLLIILSEDCPFNDCYHHLFHPIPSGSIGNKTAFYFSLYGCTCLISHPMTLEQIGTMWGLSRERIRQIEEKAIKNLREKIQNDPNLMAYLIDILRKTLPESENQSEIMEELQDLKPQGQQAVGFDISKYTPKPPQGGL